MLAAGAIPHTQEMVRSIFEVVSCWAHIEQSLIELVLNVSDSEPLLVASLLNSLPNYEAKKKVVIAACTEKLSEEDVDLIRAVLNSCEGSRIDRNNFVHSLWGCAADRPGCVIMLDPTKLTSAMGSLRQNLVQRMGLQDISVPIAIYTELDFGDSARLAKVCQDRVAQLPHSTGRHPARKYRRARLLAVPDIGKRYAEYQRRRRQSS